MVRVLREKIRSERKGDTRFEGEGGAEVLHGQKGARLNNGGILAVEVWGGSHGAVRCYQHPSLFISFQVPSHSWRSLLA